MDDPTQLLVSTPLAAGEVPGFTDSSTIQVKSAVSAVADYLENLVVFADDATYLQAPSDGPNSQGQGAWPQLQPVEGGTTTTNPLTVVVTPDGVAFTSKNVRDGYQLLTRSLTIDSAGIDIQAYLAGATIVGAIYAPVKNHTRIYTDLGTTLCWDHTHNVWSAFTGQLASSAIVWQSAAVYFGHLPIISVDACRVETPGTMLDDNYNTSYTVESPWLQLALFKDSPYPNVGGMERIGRLIGIGRMLGSGSHQLQISVFGDGNTSVPIASWSGLQTDSWDWRIRAVGKCGRIKVKLFITSATVGFAIRGFTAEMGSKKGLQRYGTTIPSF
jgi:hypothetical protein